MARTYVLKRQARKLDRIKILYLTRPNFTEDQLQAVSPMMSREVMRINWFTSGRDEPWEEAVQRVIRLNSQLSIERGIGPEKLIIHIADTILPARLRAWLYRYEIADDDEAPFFVKIVMHEFVFEEWVITGRYNL